MGLSPITVIVTSFERPANLARSLLSLALQTAAELLAEIVVADDGSRDGTWDMVDDFARRTRLPVALTTHEHGEFQPGRSRNEAALGSTAPYLAFLDGDCVVQPNFLATHAARRRPGVALCGESLRLGRLASQAVTDDVVRSDSLMRMVEPDKLRRYRLKTWRDRAYSYFRVPMRPHLTSNHFSLWRNDFERVNGFDLGFRGWGLEDHDLQRRLLLAGMRCRTVLPHTVGFHLWHPPVPSFVRDAKNTPNEEYYRQPPPPDGRARSGLGDVDRRACSVFRWRSGELVEANLAKAA